MKNQEVIEFVLERISIALKDSSPLTPKQIAEIIEFSEKGVLDLLHSNPALFQPDPNRPWAWRSARGNSGYAIQEDGLLSYMGYHVGSGGKLTQGRRDTLDRVMQSTLPKVLSANYMAE